MRKYLTGMLVAVIIATGSVFSQEVYIGYDRSMPREAYAAGKL